MNEEHCHGTKGNVSGTCSSDVLYPGGLVETCWFPQRDTTHRGRIWLQKGKDLTKVD